MGRKYYNGGVGMPPIWIQPILEKKEMFDIDFFHFTDMLDWSKQGDDLAVIEPLVAFLAQWGDNLIIAFAEKMAELLYRLDTREIALKTYKNIKYFSGDEFLYIRCQALINGKSLYNDIVKSRKSLDENLEFGAILYVPMYAWVRVHKRTFEEYDYVTRVSYETGSNKEGWEK